MNKSETILEFNKIKEILCTYAISEPAKKKLLNLKPFTHKQEIENHINETTQARYILDNIGTPPLSAMKEIDKIIVLCEKDYMLLPEQLESVASFISSCKRIKSYLKKAESEKVDVAYYGQSIYELSELQTEIETAIQNNTVLNSASNELNNIRRKLQNENENIKNKLHELLRSKKNIFSDSYISQRNGHYTLPIKKEYKNQINGTVIDVSGTGGTYFIEPSSVAKLQNNIIMLEIEEENEIRKILYTLTAFVNDSLAEIKINMEAMVTLDIIFSKAKYSFDINAVPASINTNRIIQIEQGRHPLLKQSECIPLNFSIGGSTKGIVITGPNTGGKTVAIKTVGLLSMMAQSGLHVPVKSGNFCINNSILCDIGDGQSITENLSTFSAHITNIINILNSATSESLILLDELGSGTDPAEGMGIAISILEELRLKNCLFVATTHYPEVKEYANNTEGIINARMAFDRESLKPLYKLEIGEAGESCALYIAKRLGFPDHMLERAYKQSYNKIKENTLIQNDYNAVKAKHENSIENLQAKPMVEKSKKINTIHTNFKIGDSVIVSPEKNIGFVFQPEDKKGLIGVQIKGEKFFINYKRIKLKTSASKLYPPDYDFSIIFDTVENRKIRHKMERKYVPNDSIIIEEK